MAAEAHFGAAVQSTVCNLGCIEVLNSSEDVCGTCSGCGFPASAHLHGDHPQVRRAIDTVLGDRARFKRKLEASEAAYTQQKRQKQELESFNRELEQKLRESEAERQRLEEKVAHLEALCRDTATRLLERILPGYQPVHLRVLMDSLNFTAGNLEETGESPEQLRNASLDLARV